MDGPIDAIVVYSVSLLHAAGDASKKTMSVLDRASPASSANALRHVLSETRTRFVATFAGRCDAIQSLVERVAALGPSGPITELTQVSHRLSGLAGTIGFPTVSVRSSELEGLVGEASCGTFDARLASDAVDAIRKAFATDLASPPAYWTPSAIAAAEASPIVVTADTAGQRTIASTPVDAAGHAPAVRVLIVDDHAIVRRGLRALLSEEFHGAAYGEASDARQALEELRRQKWDVALLDMTLPGKSGLDFLKELRAEWPTLPVLVLSGHPEDQFAVRVLKAGASGYLTKESAPGVGEGRPQGSRRRPICQPRARRKARVGRGRISRARRTKRSPTASMPSCLATDRVRP
jgi:CheY-like chemotaxis protein